MARPTRPVQATLLLSSILGFYTTWYLFYANGSVTFMTDIRETAGNAWLPAKEARLREVYTGYKAIDYQLTVLVLFFWQLIDGSSPHAALHGFHFAGQIVAGWGLMMMEGRRAGNRWRAVSFIALWGCLAQNITFAVTVPIWAALHLATSPTISPSNANISITPSELVHLGTSITLGFIVPSLLMVLPAPTILNYQAKQGMIAFWQAFPIWTCGIQMLLSTAFGPVFSSKARGETEQMHQKAVSHAAYSYLLTVAGVTHVCTAVLVLSSTLFPAIYSTQSQGMFNFAKVFIPFAVTPAAKSPTLVDGLALLIQWDEIVGSLAVLLWTTFLYVRAYEQDGKPTDTVGLALRLLIGTVTTGPLGCAVLLMWSRDDLVHGKNAKPKTSI